MPSTDISQDDTIKKCIENALDITEDIRASDYRLEAFKVVLSKLIDLNVGVPITIKPSITAKKVDSKTVNGTEKELIDAEDQIPLITPVGSAPGNAMALFDTAWGQKRRTVRETSSALDANNVPDSHLTQTLKRLAEQKKLRSFKQDGELVYWKNPDYKPE